MVAGHLQEKRGTYYMVLNLTDEHGKRKTKWIPTHLPVKGNKRKAEAMLQEERRKYSSSKAREKGRADMLFADYMLYWLDQVKFQVDVGTYPSYKYNVEKRIEPYFRQRDVTLAGLQACDIKEFYTHCQKTLGISNNTVIHYHANISAALNHAVSIEILEHSPMKKGLRPKEVKHVAQFYTLEETERLIELIRDDGVEFPVLMATFYGLRREEIMGLKWDAIDFQSNTISVKHTVIQVTLDGKNTVVAKDRTKNQSSYRTLPLVPQYRELLLRMKERQEMYAKICGDCYHHSDYIYVNELGIPYKPNYVTQHFALMLKKLGLRKITFHELRHTCASLLLKSNVSMKDIQAWLGHSTYHTTANIYAHLDSSSKELTSSAMIGNINIEKSLAEKANDQMWRDIGEQFA